MYNERGLLTQLAYFSLEFVEFLEFFCRIADAKYSEVAGDLTSKIDMLMD